MIGEELSDRIKTFISSLPGVDGFNIMLRYGDRVEMMGVDFPLAAAAETMTGMVIASEAADQGAAELPLVN